MWLTKFESSAPHFLVHGVSDHSQMSYEGSVIDQLYCRVKLLKSDLGKLNRAHYSDLAGRVKECSDRLSQVQRVTMQGSLSQEDLIEERNLRFEFARLSRVEVSLMSDKARATWIEKGDLSTSFFFRSVLAYKNQHKISVVMDDCRRSITKPEGIEELVVNFYKGLFRSKGPLTLAQSQMIKDVIVVSISEEACLQLNVQPSSDFYEHHWKK
ncbi:hypothetical protein LIER_15964 [Lithospermum erythrorhizon]|uniref:Uncharacterized protein n=1 Tax=Lithospermum erythrorhizon TaxID=34254 RepID=A0AAV3Q5T1_LITER